MKPTIFFLMNSIDINRGGLTRASLKQASFFAELGYKTYMLTFNFNPRNPLIKKELIDTDRLHKDVIVKNMYEDFEGNNEYLKTDAPPKEVSLTELSNDYHIHKRKGRNAYRVFENGLYTKYLSFHKKTSILHFIDYFNENRYRTRRELFDFWGNLKRVSFMDFSLNKPRQIIYYDTNKKAYLTEWINPENDRVQRSILFNEDSSVKKSYTGDNISLKVDWLKQLINNINSDQSVVISDTRSTDEVLVNFNHKKTAKVWRLHSSHIGNPYHPDSKIAPPVRMGIENIDSFDAAVFLTEQQKRDVINRFGEKSNLHVVHHYHELPSKSLLTKTKKLLSKPEKNNKLAIVVSRLSTLKRIDHIIKSFKIVVDEIPDAHLEVYGIGDEMKKLKRLIKELNLQKNVFMKGYSNNPDNIYERGLFSVLTSKQEGFALSILESMVSKTPVISYNINYGPNDMIVNNKNGFIVNNEDIDQLAEKMLYLFNNPSKAILMGEKANKYINRHFNKDIYEKQWLEVIDSAIKNKFN